jgi:VWFA-related protein
MTHAVLRLLAALVLSSAAAGVVSPVAPSVPQTEQGIRIDVAAQAQVRVENRFGAVRAEVWSEKFVLINASIAGGATLKRSPVTIETRNQQLLISISRTPLDPAVPIDLNVKVPANAHAEMITLAGQITLVGLPAMATVNSGSGDITVEFPDPPNADINARSASGTINSELQSPLSDGGRVLRARLGAGERVLKVSSDKGQISLLLPKSVNNAVAPQEPVLVGRDNPAPGAGTPANTTGTEEVGEGDVVRVDSQLVSLNMSVIDRMTNRGLLGLGQGDFKLFEDGTEQQIVQFDSAAAPFDLILLVDLSGSTRDVVKLIRAAALRFVEAARPSDRIGVITFAGQPAVISPVTLDRQLLRQRIESIDTAPGDTKLYDSAEFAITQNSDRRNSRRTAVVLMSDGLDGTVPGVSGQQGSKLDYRELIRQVQEFDGVLYTLWLNTYYEALHPQDTQPEAFDVGHDRMKELAEAGGGTFYEVQRLADLAGAYERVVADLGTVYTLAYRPTNKSRDGKWRAIKVQVNRQSAVARGKHGYYAN